MPILVADANLPTVGTEGFFNELESDILAAITAGGTGHYKLTQERVSGTFVAVEAATEIPDGAALNDLGDRFELAGELHDFTFIHFSV